MLHTISTGNCYPCTCLSASSLSHKPQTYTLHHLPEHRVAFTQTHIHRPTGSSRPTCPSAAPLSRSIANCKHRCTATMAGVMRAFSGVNAGPVTKYYKCKTKITTSFWKILTFQVQRAISLKVMVGF